MGQDSLACLGTDSWLTYGCESIAGEDLLGHQPSAALFKVQLRYACEGMPLGLQLETDLATVALNPEGNLVQEVSIVGQAYVRLGAKEPVLTQQQVVRKGCSLRIESVSAQAKS